MRKGDRRRRKRSQRLAARAAASRAPSRSPRDAADSESYAPRSLYQLSPRHLLVLKELDRLFPDLAPIVDFESLDPGVESVESIARLLLEILAQRFERPVFLAFGEINSERLLDHIEQQITAAALPLSAQEIFSEVMFRLFQRLQQRDRFGRLARLPAAARDWRRIDPHDPARTIFELLAAGARVVLDEQVQWLKASTIPLPGIPAPCVKPPRSIVSDGSRLLLESSVQLSDGEAERWVAHALMQLPDEARRLIYLRRHQNLDAKAIGDLLGVKPFDVLLQLKRAELDFQEQIRTTLERFLGRAVADPPTETQAVPGRLVHWPQPRDLKKESRDSSVTREDSSRVPRDPHQGGRADGTHDASCEPSLDDFDLEPVLNGALKVRRASELAHDLWVIAASIYRMAPETDRNHTQFGGDVGRMDPRAALESAMHSIFRSWQRSRSPSLSCDVHDLDSPVLETTRDVLSSIEKAGRPATILKLLTLADDIGRKPNTGSLLLRSEVDWYYRGGTHRVSLLEAAYRGAATPRDRMFALNNLAVTCFSSERPKEAQRLALRAIDIVRVPCIATINCAIWKSALGERSLGDAMFETVARFRSRRQLLASWTQSLTRSVVASVERGLSRRPGSLEFICDRILMLRGEVLSGPR